MTKFIMVMGLSGSGKSYHASKLAVENDAEIVSSDDVREEVYGNACIQRDHAEIFKIVHERTLDFLVKGISVIVDATNLGYKFRMQFLQKISRLEKMEGIEIKKEVYIVATPIEECISNNLKRERNVPEEIIVGMMKRFQVPTAYEGWNKIGILWNYYRPLTSYHGTRVLQDLKHYNQDNKNHCLTLGEHMMKAGRSLDDAENMNQRLIMATFLHDIGKPETKTFFTMKGEKTDNAHYYCHEHVGSYKSMFILRQWGYSDEECLDVARLIRFHMRPYFADTDKSKRKLRRQIGEELYEDLMKLHKADVLAH